MKNPQKAIKIVSIITLVYGIIVGLLGILATVGGGIGTSLILSNGDKLNQAAATNGELQSSVNTINGYLGSNASAADITAALTGAVAIIGIIVIFVAIYQIVYSIVGLKASNGKCVTAAFVMGIIDLVLCILSVISSFQSGAFVIVMGVIGLILSAIYTYSAYLIKNKN